MTWVFALLGIGLIAALGLVIAGKLPPVPQPTRPPQALTLPPQPTAADIDQLRLPVGLRGYRMEEVDAALAILRNRIAELEAPVASETWTGAPDGTPQDPPTDS